jgi:hypothetical protein
MESQQMMEFLLAMRENMLGRLDENAKTSQQGMLAMREERKSDREEMKQEIRVAQEKVQENLKRTVEEIMVKFRGPREGTMSDPDQTEPSPEMMQSVGEHQEIAREEAAVIPVR